MTSNIIHLKPKAPPPPPDGSPVRAIDPRKAKEGDIIVYAVTHWPGYEVGEVIRAFPGGCTLQHNIRLGRANDGTVYAGRRRHLIAIIDTVWFAHTRAVGLELLPVAVANDIAA